MFFEMCTAAQELASAESLSGSGPRLNSQPRLVKRGCSRPASNVCGRCEKSVARSSYWHCLRQSAAAAFSAFLFLHLGVGVESRFSVYGRRSEASRASRLSCPALEKIIRERNVSELFAAMQRGDEIVLGLGAESLCCCVGA